MRVLLLKFIILMAAASAAWGLLLLLRMTSLDAETRGMFSGCFGAGVHELLSVVVFTTLGLER